MHTIEIMHRAYYVRIVGEVGAYPKDGGNQSQNHDAEALDLEGTRGSWGLCGMTLERKRDVSGPFITHSHPPPAHPIP